ELSPGAGRQDLAAHDGEDPQGAAPQVTEIDGHYNMPDKLGYACRLLRKAVGVHGARLVVVADAALLDAIDLALWKLAPSDFVAHCRSDDPPYIVQRSPVVLADSTEAALPDRPILVNLGAELPA